MEDDTISFEKYVDTKNIVLPQGLLKVKDEAFYNWRKTQSVSIPPGVAKIGNKAFYCCANLSALVLPPGVEAIGEEAFAHCMSLSSICIPDGVTRISKGAFAGCVNLKSVHLPQSLDQIEEMAFFGCTSLESIDIPSSTHNIDHAAFAFCENLKELKISSRIQLIDSFAFYGCPLEKLLFGGTRLLWDNFESHIIRMGNSVLFSTRVECNELSGQVVVPVSPDETVVDQLSIPMEFAEKRYIKSMTIREGTEKIYGWTFYGCFELELIELPKSLKYMGYKSFYDVWKLNTVVYGGTREQWRKFITSRNFGHGNTAVFYAKVLCSDGIFDERGTADLVVPFSDGKSVIKDNAFKNHIELKSVVIEEGITQIGKRAFCGCVNLESVTIPKSVAVIERSAFCDCGMMETIVIPEGVLEIKKEAFDCCTSLRYVFLPVSLETYGHYAFYDCAAIETVHYAGTKAQWQELSLVNRFKEFNKPLVNAEVICKDGTYSIGVAKKSEEDIRRAEAEMKKRQAENRTKGSSLSYNSNPYNMLAVFKNWPNWANDVILKSIEFRIKFGVFPTAILASDATYTKIVEVSEAEGSGGPDEADEVQQEDGKEELPPPGEDATEQEVQAWVDSCFAGFDTDISTDEMLKDGFPLLLVGNRLVSPFYSLKMLCSDTMPLRLYHLMYGEPPTDGGDDGEFVQVWKSA